ncbi:MAG: alpha-L-fucosidase [Lentisphaerae bacterium]|nr:alpha-L-fucosidase [Lentisphaerota bacterium]
MEKSDSKKMEWFIKARFGMFVHYGLYSLLGRGEWVMNRERIPAAESRKLAESFTAENFDAGKIAWPDSCRPV